MKIKISPEILADKGANAISTRAILLRMLGNLCNLYLGPAKDAERLLLIQRYIRRAPPSHPASTLL